MSGVVEGSNAQGIHADGGNEYHGMQSTHHMQNTLIPLQLIPRGEHYGRDNQHHIAPIIRRSERQHNSVTSNLSTNLNLSPSYLDTTTTRPLLDHVRTHEDNAMVNQDIGATYSVHEIKCGPYKRVISPRRHRPRELQTATHNDRDRTQESTINLINHGACDDIEFSTFDQGSRPVVAERRWISVETKIQYEWDRVKRALTRYTSQEFSSKGEPIWNDCDIFPKSLEEYREHRKKMMDICGHELQRNIAIVKEKIRRRETHSKIQSAFCKTNARFRDGYSAVLCLDTVFSNHGIVMRRRLSRPLATWPTQTELQVDGDNREQYKTKCGRYLPLPRDPRHTEGALHERPFLPSLPFDRTGPVHSDGRPSILIVETENMAMNNSPRFDARCRALLGSDLMRELDGFPACWCI